MAPSSVTGVIPSRNRAGAENVQPKVPLIPPGDDASTQPLPTCLLSSSSTDLVTVALPGLCMGTQSRNQSFHRNSRAKNSSIAPANLQPCRTQGAWLLPENPSKSQQSAEKNVCFSLQTKMSRIKNQTQLK